MKIFYTQTAVTDLKRLPRDAQKRIATKMRFYAAQKQPLKFAERLTDAREGQYRFRVGAYRVIFDVEKNEVWVLKIGKRSEVYER